jgi:hypothetical protein
MNGDQQPARFCVLLVCFAGAKRASRGKSEREMRDLGLHVENGITNIIRLGDALSTTLGI